MNADPKLHVFRSSSELFSAAAQHFVQTAAAAIAARDRFTVALSGGSTPKALFRCLVGDHRESFNWHRTFFFWSDERTVPPAHPDSNFLLAKEGLLDPLGIAADKICRLRGEDDPAAAAAAYVQQLSEVMDASPEAAPPALDLVILGVGLDGHTASLFPRTAALNEQRRWVIANEVPQLNTWRLTMTAPLINASREVMILATGTSKSSSIANIIQGPKDPDTYPAQLVAPSAGELSWYLDETAAAKLDRRKT